MKIRIFKFKIKVILVIVFFVISQSITIAQPSDNPIAPNDYADMLGIGFDASWTKNYNQFQKYNVNMLKDIAEKGFKHIRIRTNLESSSDYINLSRPVVDDCLENNVIPILAFGGHALEENPDSTNKANFIKWWRRVAEHYKDYSHKLTFNLLIEVSGELKNMPDTLNSIYERTVAAIRETNPTRIIIIAPRKLSDPFNLHELKVPTQANGYLMWEWHFYASGPSKTSKNKLWTTGTDAEKKLITDKIKAAIDWEEETGIPSWVGAWMPGNYNKGNDYTVPEQVIFSSFMIRELEKAKVPSAVNAVQHFYRYTEGLNEWNNEKRPVIDVILDPWKAVLYSGKNYKGDSFRIDVGEYDKTFLEENNLLSNFKSVMVPADYKIITYNDSGFTGTETIYNTTQNSIEDNNGNVVVKSIKVEYDTVTTSVNIRKVSKLFNEFHLGQNYPNPFNPTTTIEYSLPSNVKRKTKDGFIPGEVSGENVTLKVYDILGREVATLVNETKQPGNYKVIFNASQLPSGIYFYKLKTNDFSKSKKMILLR